MPFDATTHRSMTVRHPDALRNMGLVPVSWWRVRHHKRTVAANWKAQYRGTSSAFVLARWQTISISRLNLLAELTVPLRRVRTQDISAAPPQLIDLAMEVDRTVEDARFSLQYFDIDPILQISYDADRRVACLGIWDKGKIIAIASPPSEWRKLWWSIR